MGERERESRSVDLVWFGLVFKNCELINFISTMQI